MSVEPRFCPLCERRLAEKTCPIDGVPTVEVRAMEPAGAGALAPGSVFGERYRILRAIGGGGMGEVYLATQLSMQRAVALKVLSCADGLAPEKRVRRFYKEAQAASALHHPNIVRVYDFGVDDATRLPFLAMEYIEGETLSSLVKREGPLGERRSARVLAQVARGLVEAHQKGIVHRDLKPRNVMVTLLADGVEHVRLLDFGIARMRPPGSEDEIPRLTAEGVAVGTPEYMSPEQARGRDPDFRADLYSLGCVLHELLSGRPPFTAHEPVAVMLCHVRDPVPPLETIPPASEDLRVLHAALLAKAPEDRPGSTAVVARLLQALAAGEQPGAREMIGTPAAGSRSAGDERTVEDAAIGPAREGTLSAERVSAGEASGAHGSGAALLAPDTGVAGAGRGSRIALAAAALTLVGALVFAAVLIGSAEEDRAASIQAEDPRMPDPRAPDPLAAEPRPRETDAGGAPGRSSEPAVVAGEREPPSPPGARAAPRKDAARKPPRARPANAEPTNELPAPHRREIDPAESYP